MTDLTKLFMASAGANGAAQWTIVGTASGVGTVSFPAGYQAGDYVLAIVNNPNATGAGWTILMTGVQSRVFLLAGITNQSSFAGSSQPIVLVVLRPINVPTAGMFAGVIYEKSMSVWGSQGFYPPPLTTTTNNNIVFVITSYGSGGTVCAPNRLHNVGLLLLGRCDCGYRLQKPTNCWHRGPKPI